MGIAGGLWCWSVRDNARRNSHCPSHLAAYGTGVIEKVPSAVPDGRSVAV